MDKNRNLNKNNINNNIVETYDDPENDFDQSNLCQSPHKQKEQMRFYQRPSLPYSQHRDQEEFRSRDVRNSRNSSFQSGKSMKTISGQRYKNHVASAHLL